jgi:hypothetical protein
MTPKLNKKKYRFNNIRTRTSIAHNIQPNFKLINAKLPTYGATALPVKMLFFFTYKLKSGLM